MTIYVDILSFFAKDILVKFLWIVSRFGFHDLELQSEAVTLAKPAVADRIGRDAAAVAQHIEEFQALGVSPDFREAFGAAGMTSTSSRLSVDGYRP